MLEYVEEKLKQYHQDNPLVKAMLCCCKCCFWCLEKFMKFINRNAYIMTAVYGKNFCWSAKEAFSLLLRNVARYRLRFFRFVAVTTSLSRKEFLE